jgi:S1-C subfamily serine protease
LISDNRILTNAHIASNARFIAIEKEGDSRRYEARVRFIAHDCDLAILEVDDASFYEGMQPLVLGGIPELDSTVTVLGYPIGGNRLSVTRGVVSRIDFQVYSHSDADSHLAIQIDAAINPGNSGGPVFQDNAVVGVAFQGYSGRVAQNVGYMIPVPVLKRFLVDIADGSYDAYVDLGAYHFPLINPTYRRALGLGPGDYGVMISQVIQAGASHGVLERGDVLLRIDNLPIFSNGTVEMDGEKLLLNEVVERLHKGDSVRLKIYRKKVEREVVIQLNSPWPYLMMARRHNVKPRYVLFSGLLFQPLTNGFIGATDARNINLLYHYYKFLDSEIYTEKPEVVVLSRILPDQINTYLAGFKGGIVESINGKTVRTLEDVAAGFQEKADFFMIRFEGTGQPIVLDSHMARTAHERIMQRYGISRSEYLEDSIVPEKWLSRRDKEAQ